MKVSKKLIKNNLISGNKVCAIFDLIYGDILDLPLESVSVFMQTLWDRYNNESQNLRGWHRLVGVLIYTNEDNPL